MNQAADILEIVSAKRAKGEPFALATVVRTVSMTAAKAGAKAVVLPDGTISEGWIGGGCARSAVLKAAKEALADGRVRLVSIQPGDLLDEQGVAPGEEREGVRFAKNTCPSQGTMDIFVEPVLPRPEIIVCGSSPVAVAVADLGRRLGFLMTACGPRRRAGCLRRGRAPDRRLRLAGRREGMRFIVVSTQSRGDEAALQAALSVDADYVAFVGSRRKAETLKAKLRAPRRRRGPDRGAEIAGRARPRRDHARGDRPLDPLRDRPGSAEGPAGASDQ